MTGHPFRVWLDSDRTGPVPAVPVPQPDAGQGQYWLSRDGEVIHLWCHLCTAGGDDYLGEWETPPGDEYEREVSAKVREHQAEKHGVVLSGDDEDDDATAQLTEARDLARALWNALSVMSEGYAEIINYDPRLDPDERLPYWLTGINGAPETWQREGTPGQ